MPLSLNAEQKELLKIFKIEEQYVIPSYQRPYSWEYDQCFQLYNDLLSGFDSQQDYFIGNIIIAKADSNKDTLEVVDGQQRLVTSLLMFKSLYLAQPEIKVLQQLLEKEDWEGNDTIPRVKSEVFEANDDEALREVLRYNHKELSNRYLTVADKNGKINERLCKSRFEINIIYFYSWIKFFQENRNDLKDFTFYLLKQVYLLPIELTGPSQDEANEKALVIFETINNRGMNLEDADIFKAKLYNRAKKISEQTIFIELWSDFKVNCDNLGFTIDDVFRLYSHIIRGREGITTSEKNIREFFINEKFSPLILNKYKEVLADLFKIIEILELLNQEKIKQSSVAKWLQIIEAYSNQYPRYALVNYLFVNNLKVDDDFEYFLKALVRYLYYQGSTSTVKFEIYNIIKQTTFGAKIDPYYKKEIPESYFSYLGRLKKGFALLAFYLKKTEALPTYNIDKIISPKDKKLLTEDWSDVNLFSIVDSLGNTVILDMPKKDIPYDKKAEYYEKSMIGDVNKLFRNGQFTYIAYLERDRELKSRLVGFFTGAE